MIDMPSCFGTVKSPQERAENDCITCRYVRQCDTVETEIRTLRAERDFHDRAAQEAIVLANAAVAERDAAVQAEVAAMNDLQAHKDALAQVGEFICRKCGRRQEATFAPGDF